MKPGGPVELNELYEAMYHIPCPKCGELYNDSRVLLQATGDGGYVVVGHDAPMFIILWCQSCMHLCNVKELNLL